MNISRYLFLLLLLSLVLSPGNKVTAQSDTLFSPTLTLGVEVSGLVREWMQPGIIQYEGSLSYEWRKDWFASIEGGALNINIEKQTHNYFAEGWFLRAGVDYNLLQRNERNLYDMVLLILRYGYGNLNHESTKVIISSPYWEDYQTFFPREAHNAHWLELGAGIKARIAANFYLGWSIRTRLILSQSQASEMEPYIISGFGKSANNPNAVIHYSLYYLFPF